MEKMDHYVMPGNRMRYNCNFHVIPAKTLCHNYDLAVIPALDAGIQGFSFKSFERLKQKTVTKTEPWIPVSSTGMTDGRGSRVVPGWMMSNCR